MKNKILITCILILSVTACKTPAKKKFKPVSALVLQVMGRVLITDADKIEKTIDKWHPVKTNMVIKAGKVIRTRRSSSCDIQLSNGSVLRIKDNSLLEINKLLAAQTGATRSNFKLHAGKVLSKPSELETSDSSYDITTPTALAGVRGTEFMVEHTNGTTNVAVNEGTVALTRNISLNAEQDNPQLARINRIAREQRQLNAGQAATVNRTENQRIIDAAQQVRRGQRVNIQTIENQTAIKPRKVTEKEKKVFVEFKDIRKMKAREKAKYGVLLIFGGDGTEIYIDEQKVANDMVMKIIKVGKHKVKVMKGTVIIKSIEVDIKSKKRTIINVSEPNFTAPETTEERNTTRMIDRDFVRQTQSRMERQIENTSSDLERRSRNRRTSPTLDAQRRAVRNPDQSNYGTGEDVMQRLRQRRGRRTGQNRTNRRSLRDRFRNRQRGEDGPRDLSQQRDNVFDE